MLVTRPVAQTGAVRELFERAGATVHLLPTIEIGGPEDEAALEQIIRKLPEFDIAIFISPNAVNAAIPRIHKLHGKFPAGLALATVGGGSERALAAHGLKAQISPAAGFKSETLLADPALQDVAGKRIMIFRGRGGRALLGGVLGERGAEIVYAECYQRLRPDPATQETLDAWRLNPVSLVTATSAEGIENLYHMLDTETREILLSTPIIVISPRQQTLCYRFGFKSVILAHEASDSAMLEAALAWRAKQKPV